MAVDSDDDDNDGEDKNDEGSGGGGKRDNVTSVVATTAAAAEATARMAAAAAAAKATATATAATTEVVSWWYLVRGSGSVTYDSTCVFLQIHFLRSILRRPHTDRISEGVKKKFRRNRNRDSCGKSATGAENTGIRRIPAGL